MLSCTSLVPPSIEKPLLRSHSRGSAMLPRPAASHANPSAPTADINSSCLRLLSSLPANFIIDDCAGWARPAFNSRSEEHTSELQSLLRNSYAVFCLKKKKQK